MKKVKVKSIMTIVDRVFLFVAVLLLVIAVLLLIQIPLIVFYMYQDEFMTMSGIVTALIVWSLLFISCFAGFKYWCLEEMEDEKKTVVEKGL